MNVTKVTKLNSNITPSTVFKGKEGQLESLWIYFCVPHLMAKIK